MATFQSLSWLKNNLRVLFLLVASVTALSGGIYTVGFENVVHHGEHTTTGFTSHLTAKPLLGSGSGCATRVDYWVHGQHYIAPWPPFPWGSQFSGKHTIDCIPAGAPEQVAYLPSHPDQGHVVSSTMNWDGALSSIIGLLGLVVVLWVFTNSLRDTGHDDDTAVDE